MSSQKIDSDMYHSDESHVLMTFQLTEGTSILSLSTSTVMTLCSLSLNSVRFTDVHFGQRMSFTVSETVLLEIVSPFTSRITSRGLIPACCAGDHLSTSITCTHSDLRPTTAPIHSNFCSHAST